MKNKYSILSVLLLWAVVANAAPPQRIISVSPDSTEILYGVGSFDRVVGVSDFCTYPAAVNTLPRVGAWTSPSLERIVGLRPDLVVLTAAQSSLFGYHLQQLGVPTVVVPTRSVQDAYTAIGLIGSAVGKQREAQLLVDKTKATLDKVHALTKNRNKPSVLIAVDRSPGSLRDLYIATQGSFLAELVEFAGGRVVGEPAKSGYSKISKETLLKLNADIVLELKMGASTKSVAQARADWNELPELNAVRSGRVYELQEDFLVHCSQRIAESAVLLARIIHPEIPAKELETTR